MTAVMCGEEADVRELCQEEFGQRAFAEMQRYAPSRQDAGDGNESPRQDAGDGNESPPQDEGDVTESPPQDEGDVTESPASSDMFRQKSSPRMQGYLTDPLELRRDMMGQT
jgi:hypothetical protein